MCIYTVGSLWGAWTSVLIIEVSTVVDINTLIVHTCVSDGVTEVVFGANTLM